MQVWYGFAREEGEALRCNGEVIAEEPWGGRWVQVVFGWGVGWEVFGAREFGAKGLDFVVVVGPFVDCLGVLVSYTEWWKGAGREGRRGVYQLL